MDTPDEIRQRKTVVASRITLLEGMVRSCESDMADPARLGRERERLVREIATLQQHLDNHDERAANLPARLLQHKSDLASLRTEFERLDIDLSTARKIVEFQKNAAEAKRLEQAIARAKHS